MAEPPGGTPVPEGGQMAAGVGIEQDEVDVTGIDLSVPDVIIVEAPDGKRSVVKGQDLVAEAPSQTARGAARVMTIRCTRWSEVAFLLSRLGAGP